MEKVYSGTDRDGLKKIVTAMLRSSISSSTCGLSIGNISDAVQPPVFVPSRIHLCQNKTPPLFSPPTQPKSTDSHSNNSEKQQQQQQQQKKKKKSLVRKMPNATVTRSAKLLSNGYGFTSGSSDDNANGTVLFSSDDDSRPKHVKEETETLFSSKSFSSDSSEFYTKKKKKPPSSFRRRPQKSVVGQSGTAVLKNSTDPYGDFRSSVLEMILENQILEKVQLKQLLLSYLNLNSDSQHPVILQESRESLFMMCTGGWRSSSAFVRPHREERQICSVFLNFMSSNKEEFY